MIVVASLDRYAPWFPARPLFGGAGSRRVLRDGHCRSRALCVGRLRQHCRGASGAADLLLQEVGGALQSCFDVGARHVQAQQLESGGLLHRAADHGSHRRCRHRSSRYAGWSTTLPESRVWPCALPLTVAPTPNRSAGDGITAGRLRGDARADYSGNYLRLCSGSPR
eukprot:scaffold1659_cov255-Pinguiococcus_pyrenoidosus.AAC.10